MKRVISLVLTAVLLVTCLFSVCGCGNSFKDGCEYAKTRDIKNRDVKYAKISSAQMSKPTPTRHLTK